MKKLALICILALAFNTTAMALDIAISTQAGWWPQGTADTEMQEIVDNVTDASVELFTAADQDALADWVIAHTGNGKSDLLILCGYFPDSIYPGGNTEPDNSLAELFLDDGNTIINTGDWIFYVNSAGTNNNEAGLQNMMDLPSIAMWGDGTSCVVTAEGQEITPSLVDIPSSRPFFSADLTGDWYPELILAQSADGSVMDPVVVRNSATGGRVGIFIQVADALMDIRGEVISEWINNWYLPVVGNEGAMSSAPAPASGAIDVYRDTDLSWTPGEFAVTHDVYFGTVQSDVNDASRDNPMGVLISQGQTGTTYDLPGVLAFGITYYWRVDDIAADSTINKGKIWSFTAEQFVYPIEIVTATSNTTSEAGKGPENIVNGSGLNAADQHSTNTADMWGGTPNATEPSYVQFDFDGLYKLHEMLIWNYNMEFEMFLGLGVKDATIEYSENGTDWTVLGDFVLAQGPGNATYAANTAIPMEGVAAQAVRLTINSNFSGTPALYGLSEVRFLHIPINASEPSPADGDIDVAIETSLSWRPGREAVSHEINLGTDPDALTTIGTTTQSSYTPAVLDLDTTYSWQIVEVNEAEAVSAWAGNIWTFTTQEYIEVDGFEAYDDDIDAGTTIWQGWIDGIDDSTNGGAVVGYGQSPFAEQTIVRSGRQAMPLTYDNGSATAISEADHALSPAQNWTASGIESLTLWFYGAEGNAGQLYAKINGTKVLYDGLAVNLARPAWQMWSIDLSTVGNVSNVTTLSIGVQGTGSGTLYIDDVRLYPEVLDYTSPDITGPGDIVVGVPNDNDWPAAEYPALAIDDNADTKYLHFKGGSQPTGFQVAPLVGSTVVTALTFTTANDAAGRDPISFELYGSNTGIDGPYTLIASGDIVDFAGAAEWPRFTKTETPIEFANTTAYAYYQILFPTVRDANQGLMQIAEVEFIGQ